MAILAGLSALGPRDHRSHLSLYASRLLVQDSQMPLFARPVTDERDSLLTFLAQQRDALRACVLGLTDEQARTAPSASGLSLGALIKHTARTERRWVIAGIAGRPLPGLWPIGNWPDDFRMDQDETLAGLLRYYAETAAQTEQIIAEVADLGQPSAADPEKSVRWVLLLRWAWSRRLLRSRLDDPGHDPAVLADCAVTGEPELLIGRQSAVVEEAGGH